MAIALTAKEVAEQTGYREEYIQRLCRVAIEGSSHRAIQDLGYGVLQWHRTFILFRLEHEAQIRSIFE